ncbi:MAG TPA: hypothetical protein DCW90_22175 [Lachnospiraceae bacterium]|nr:hypothetical protein [Lachnospiraceae bacterium]
MKEINIIDEKIKAGNIIYCNKIRNGVNIPRHYLVLSSDISEPYRSNHSSIALLYLSSSNYAFDDFWSIPIKFNDTVSVIRTERIDQYTAEYIEENFIRVSMKLNPSLFRLIQKCAIRNISGMSYDEYLNLAKKVHGYQKMMESEQHQKYQKLNHTSKSDNLDEFVNNKRVVYKENYTYTAPEIPEYLKYAGIEPVRNQIELVFDDTSHENPIGFDLTPSEEITEAKESVKEIKDVHEMIPKFSGLNNFNDFDWTIQCRKWSNNQLKLFLEIINRFGNAEMARRLNVSTPSICERVKKVLNIMESKKIPYQYISKVAGSCKTYIPDSFHVGYTVSVSKLKTSKTFKEKVLDVAKNNNINEFVVICGIKDRITLNKTLEFMKENYGLDIGKLTRSSKNLPENVRFWEDSELAQFAKRATQLTPMEVCSMYNFNDVNTLTTKKEAAREELQRRNLIGGGGQKPEIG